MVLETQDEHKEIKLLRKLEMDQLEVTLDEEVSSYARIRHNIEQKPLCS